MDPDRVRAYLQISCAGLGFDIGELWWTSNKDGGSTSALAAIGRLGCIVSSSFTWVRLGKKFCNLLLLKTKSASLNSTEAVFFF
jgi:hypothetical protein